MKDKLLLKSKFFDSLKRGTGEAIIIAKNNPAIDFSNYIIKGALRDYSYNAQTEGVRSKYVFDLINLSKDRGKIRNAVIKNLLSTRKEFWSLLQLFELAKMFAEQGDKEARHAIYKRFLSKTISGGDWVGYREILDLDGLNGLFFIAEKYGKLIAKEPDYTDDGMIVNQFSKENPDIEVFKLLKNAAKTNKFIRFYLETLGKSKIKKGIKKNIPRYKDIVDEISKIPGYFSPRRIRELKINELKKIAKELIHEKDLQKIEKYLYVFKYRKFPLDNEFIFRLAKQRVTSKNRIKEFATDALVSLKSDKIRKFALERMVKTRKPEIFTRILVSNFKRGDGKILAEILNKVKEPDKIHALGSSYFEIFKSNPTKECKKPFEILYNRLTCGACRYDIVKLLIKNNVLSVKIKNEIKYDSYEETRMLSKSLLRG
ncbi:MAG: hypothetical protein LWX07_01500 [Bacteroidetes bacterium]|nr:hypothetical protein [Bacteroidota bacterium]